MEIDEINKIAKLIFLERRFQHPQVTFEKDGITTTMTIDAKNRYLRRELRGIVIQNDLAKYFLVIERKRPTWSLITYQFREARTDCITNTIYKKTSVLKFKKERKLNNIISIYDVFKPIALIYDDPKFKQKNNL